MDQMRILRSYLYNFLSTVEYASNCIHKFFETMVVIGRCIEK